MKRQMTNSSAPMLAKLKQSEATESLDQNPIYESSTVVTSTSDKQSLVQPEAEEKVDVVYAQPVKRKTSLTAKNVSEPSDLSSSHKEVVYSEALTPAMFKQPPPDPNVPMRPYAPVYAEPTTIRRNLQDKVKLVVPANLRIWPDWNRGVR